MLPFPFCLFTYSICICVSCVSLSSAYMILEISYHLSNCENDVAFSCNSSTLNKSSLYLYLCFYLYLCLHSYVFLSAYKCFLCIYDPWDQLSSVQLWEWCCFFHGVPGSPICHLYWTCPGKCLNKKDDII